MFHTFSVSVHQFFFFTFNLIHLGLPFLSSLYLSACTTISVLSLWLRPSIINAFTNTYNRYEAGGDNNAIRHRDRIDNAKEAEDFGRVPGVSRPCPDRGFEQEYALYSDKTSAWFRSLPAEDGLFSRFAECELFQQPYRFEGRLGLRDNHRQTGQSSLTYTIMFFIANLLTTLTAMLTAQV